LVRGILESLLARFGEATEYTAPTRYERVLGHAGYAVGALIVVGAVARGRGILAPVGVGELMTTVGGTAALGFLFLYWAVAYRRVPPDPWFFSHLLWLSLTYSFLFLWVTVSALALVVGILFALVVPPLALLLVYGPFLAGGLIVLWLAWRIGRGYLAYTRGAPVGPDLEARSGGGPR
jgi:hypothetical protein